MSGCQNQPTPFAPQGACTFDILAAHSRVSISYPARETTLEPSRKFQSLVDDVEELLERLDDEHSPQLDQVRRRVESTMTQAKNALQGQGRSTAAQVRHYAGMADDYITGYPRAAFASGILIGAVLGFLLASTRSSD